MKLIKHLLITFLIIVSYSSCAASETQVFVTDGCTMFIDKLEQIDKNWHACCVEHDFRYWIGGEKPIKDNADLMLKACLEDLATPFIANLMYRAVRLGNYSPIKHPTKWGWGNVDLNDKNFILNELNRVEPLLYSKEVLINEYQLAE